MRSRFRRPDPPYTPEFWDRLENELRKRANDEAQKSSGRNRFTSHYGRYARSIARPAFHGAMVLVSVVLIAALTRPAAITTGPVSTPDAYPDRLNEWVPVIQVEDPQPSLVMHAIIPKSERFVTFIATTTSDSVPMEPVEPVAI